MNTCEKSSPSFHGTSSSGCLLPPPRHALWLPPQVCHKVNRAWIYLPYDIFYQNGGHLGFQPPQHLAQGGKSRKVDFFEGKISVSDVWKNQLSPFFFQVKMYSSWANNFVASWISIYCELLHNYRDMPSSMSFFMRKIVLENWIDTEMKPEQSTTSLWRRFRFRKLFGYSFGYGVDVVLVQQLNLINF